MLRLVNVFCSANPSARQSEPTLAGSVLERSQSKRCPQQPGSGLSLRRAHISGCPVAGGWSVLMVLSHQLLFSVLRGTARAAVLRAHLPPELQGSHKIYF